MALLLHMSLSLRATFRSRLVLAVIVLVAVFASTPLFGQTAMLAFAGDDPLYYSDLYESHKTSLESGAYETASQMLQDLVAKETDALGVVAEAESQSEYFRGLAEYSRLSLEDYDLGYLVGPTRYELEAEVALYSALVESDTPQLYGRTTAMPGLNYVAYVFAQSSPLVWMLVPVILSFSLLMANRRENLLGCAPVPDAARTFSVGVSAMLLTLCVVALAFVPGFVVSSARNGLGSLAYPVVFTQDEVVLSMTLGAVLARQLALFLLGSLFVVVVCVGLSALTGSPMVACLVAAGLCAVPTISGYMDVLPQARSSSQLMSFLPTTYLALGPVAGYPGSFPAVEVVSLAGVSFERGALVLLVSSVAVAAVALAAVLLRARVREARRCGVHAWPL